VVALAWCAVLLVYHVGGAALACTTDNSDCARSRNKNGVYRGTLVGPGGRAYTSTRFSVAFHSRQSSDPRYVEGFSTDASGRYCIMWAEERVTPVCAPERTADRHDRCTVATIRHG
jgi:hypothetical protein